MNTLKNSIKKAFSASVVFVTVFSMLGLGALVPAAALASTQYTAPEDVEAGDLIEYQGAVFFINADMEIVYFPRDREYVSWYPEDPEVRNVLHIDPSTRILDFFGEPGGDLNPGVGYRSSCNLVKRTIDPTVYAVLPGNQLKAVTGDYVSALYGDKWASLVRDVDLAFWSNYTVVSGLLDDAIPHEGFVYKATGSSQTYVVMDGMGVMVDGVDPCAHQVAQSVADEIELSSDTVTYESLRSNPAQHDGSTPPTNNDPSGELTFSLSADTPETTLVPEDATHVPYLTFNVTAGSEDALLEQITFERFQLGDDQNFDKLWLVVDEVPVTNDQKVQSDDTLELSPNYTIGAGDTVTFTLMANLDQTAATTNPNGTEQDAFKIVGVQANGADVLGYTSVKGNYMVYSSYTLGTAALSVRGSNQEVQAGEAEEILGEFEIDWDSTYENEGIFKSIRLQMQGTADLSDLHNLDLREDNGQSITSKVIVWGDYVTFVIDENDQMFLDSETRRFEVVGEISGANDAETVIFEVEDIRDVHFVEADVNVGSAVTLTGLSSNRLRTYTIDAGQFTVSQNGTRTPSNEEYAKDSKEVIALAADVDLGQCVSVDGLKVYLHSDSVINDSSLGSTDAAIIDADIERAELWLISESGSEKRASSLTSVTRDTDVGTATDNTLTTDEFYYDFDQTFQLNDNDILEVRLDLDNDATTNTYKFTFSNSGANTDFDSAEYCGKDGGSTNNVANADLTGTVTGNEINITAASFTITRDDGYSSGETFIAGSDDQRFFSFVIDAANASDITVQTLNFDMAVSGDATYVTDNYQKFTGFYLLEEGSTTALGGEVDDMNSSGSLTFQNLNLGIGHGETVSVVLMGNIDTGAEATSSLTFTLDGSDSVIDDAQDEQITYSDDDASAALTISTGASLTVEVDGDSPNASIYAVGSATGDVVKDLASFALTASDGQVNITDLYIANNTSTATANTAESSADALIKTYQLVVNGTVLKEKKPVSGVARFELQGASQEIQIADDQTVVATIRGVFNDVDSATDSGQRVKIALYAIEAETEGPGTALAQDTVTGVSTTAAAGLAALDVAPTGDEMAIYKSVPTIAGLSTGGTVLNSGTQDIYKFSVAADSLGAISWASIALDVTGECGSNLNPTDAGACLTYGSIKLYEVTGSGRTEISLSSAIAATTTVASTNNEIRLAVSTSSPNNVQKISAGTSKTYVVEAAFTGIATGDSISVRIKDFSSAHFESQTLQNAMADAAFTGPFVWTDNSGTQSSQTVEQWFTGRDVYGLDTDVFTFEKA
ncbi:MAG: hypothetical protein GW939_02265 [Candidatus Magasanikbacteria bacterium]|nr:hypothetical protein [Candidatus Magasanikbacteria bacterium]NCS71785.1 hypothetical protein [Candidatus Magasanikbacteria bacterium]